MGGSDGGGWGGGWGGSDGRPGEGRDDGPPRSDGPRRGPRGVTPSGGAPPGGEIGELFAAGRRVVLRPGSVVVSEGDDSGRVILVISGRLKVSSYSEGGRETVLGFRGRGDLIGELAAIDGEPHLATVTVVEPAEIVTLTADRFVEGLRDRPEAALSVLRTVIARLRDADRKRAEFADLPADARVAERLVELAAGPVTESDVPPRDALTGPAAADAGRTSTPVALAITQAEIAGWVGCSREAANRALNRFRGDGLVAIGRGRVTVLDVEGLRRIARS
jgi:CRP/FNR family cyclic AMP-dependent transcriptional regulator